MLNVIYREETEALHKNISANALETAEIERIITELENTKKKLRNLEEKYQAISSQGVKVYPDVKHQNYRHKKRILVSCQRLRFFCCIRIYDSLVRNRFRSLAVVVLSDLT